jgi:class 3 adenylate cyclase
MILSQCINDYLTLLIKVVMECHGDIITFAGDAFLAFWPYDSSLEAGSSPKTPLLHAARCALKLQEMYNTYQVPGTTVILRIHVGIAYGSLMGVLITYF